MNISRLSTILLILAIAVFALGHANPSFAAPKKCKKNPDAPGCGGGEDPPGSTGYTVALTTGAFILTDEPVTRDGDALNGKNDVTIERPGVLIGDCTTIRDMGDDELADACDTWGNVFDVCGLYDIWGPDPFGPDEFMAPAGRRGWQVYRFSGGVRAAFETSINSPISPQPLDVALWLTSDCDFAGGANECTASFPPDAGASSTFTLARYWIHATGKKGVTHQAECHVGRDPLSPLPSTLVITATTPP